MSYFNDPAQALFLQLSSAQADLDQRSFETLARDPNFARSLSAGSVMYPQASSNLLLAAANGGIPMESPEFQQIVGQEAQVREVQGPIDTPGEGFWNDVAGVWDEWVDNPTKGAVRWTFSAWDAAYNMVAGGAPIRAMMLSSQTGESFADAWQEQDPYFFEALGGVFAGEEVNLGSGWMPNSDVATGVEEEVNAGMMQLEQDTAGLGTNEKYVARLEGSPDVWKNAVAGSLEQQEMGRPLTQLAAAAAESVMFNIPRIGGGTSVTPWSPGRIGASTVLEPGSEGFKWVSGTGDFLSQMFADPVEWAGLWWMKAGKAGRMLNSEVVKASKEIVEGTDKARDASRTIAASDFRWMTDADMPSVGYGYESTDVVDKAFRNVEAGPPAIPASTGGRPAGSGARRTPWWLSPTEIKDRTLQAFDEPKWYVDEMAARRESVRAARDDAKMVRSMPGQYTINLGGERGFLRIQRKGKGKNQRWVVTDKDGSRLRNVPDDPRFTGEESFRTLKEAEAAARGRVQRGTDNLRINGMTPDEFTASGEDFFFPDGMQYMKDGVRIGPNQAESMNRLRGVRRKGRKGDNVKVRVFGRSLDLTDRKVAGKPAGLIKALKADRKLINGAKDIAGNPAVDSFTNTRRWMEQNGYGKIQLDADSVLISEKYIGGDPSDVRSRVWFERGDRPMTTMHDGIDEIGSVTPDEVNAYVDMYARTGAEPGPEFADLEAARTAAVSKVERLTEEGLPLRSELEFTRAGIRDLEKTLKSLEAPRLPGEAAGADDGGNTVKSIRKELDEARASEATINEGVAAAERIQRQAVKDEAAATRALRSATTSDADKAMAGNVVENAAGKDPLTPELGGVRVDYDGEKAANILNGDAANLFIGRLTATTRKGGQTNRAAMDKLLQFLTRQGIKVPGDFRKALFEAPDQAAVRAIFARMLTEEGGGAALLPGQLGGRIARARGNTRVRDPRITWKDKPFFARRSAKMLPTKNFNVVDDPEGAYALMDQMLPNYNISRGSDLVVGGKTVVTADEVEKLFDMLAEAKPGDGTAAFEAIKGFSEVFFKSLVGKGVHPDLAKTATHYFADMDGIRAYDTARVGANNIKDGPVDEFVFDDVLVGGIDGPQVTAQSWNGAMFFPDAHTVKVIANDSDKMGRIMNRLANKYKVNDDTGMLAVERRAWNLLMTNTMNRIWKPFVLLRAAWTIRIMMDDQLRIAGDGYDVMFKHPIRILNYAFSRGEDWRTAFTKGYVDVFDEVISVKNIDNLAHGDILKASAMSKGDRRVGGGPGTRGTKHRINVGRDDSKYKVAVAGEIRMLRSDSITSALAGSKAQNPVEEVTQYLMGNGLKEKDKAFWAEARRRLSTFNKKLPAEDLKKILAGDYDTIYKLVSRQDAMMRQTIGGRVVFDDGVGNVRDYTQFTKVEDITSDMKGTPKWRVIEPGDQELLDIVGKRTSLVGDLKTDESMKGLESLIAKKVKENRNAFPNQATMSDVVRTGDTAKTFADNADSAVGMFFEWFMSKPSDTFSRIPLFSQAYWDRMGTVANNLSPEDFATALERARKGGIEKAFLKAKKQGAEFANEGALSLEKADEMAKAFGFAQVERTLFDLVNKRNISDSLNLIFPFVEAWGEFLTRWGRIMVAGDRNVANARRLQQGVEGLREDSGFFSENQFGDEVFNYPAFMTKFQVKVFNTINNIPGLSNIVGEDISDEVADSIIQQGRAEGLNFMSSIIPGFGPVFQYAAKGLPNDPGFDGLRELVAPYGTEGGFSMFAPAWAKRVLAAWGGASDPTLTYQYTSTVQDVMRTYMNTGRFEGVTTAEEVKALTTEAEAEARGLLMVRAASTFFAPTAPSLRWQVEDESGRIWGYSQLGAEYRKIEDEIGSEIAAFDEFYRRFGQLPTAFTFGRTYSVTDRSLTIEGSKFERGNDALFNRYPNSAMFLDPNIGISSEYDHSAMIQQLKASEREQWTADQMVYLQQDFYGDAMMDNQRQMAMQYPKGATRNAFLANARAEIEQLYPRWNKQIAGKMQGQRNEDQIVEVLGMMNDPDLAGKPIIIALRDYASQRQDVLNTLNANGISTINGSKGDIATLARGWLRDEAERLGEMYPEFEPMYRKVFFPEVSESNDALPEPVVDMWGDGDIFEQVLGMVSDNAAA